MRKNRRPFFVLLISVTLAIVGTYWLLGDRGKTHPVVLKSLSELKAKGPPAAQGLPSPPAKAGAGIAPPKAARSKRNRADLLKLLEEDRICDVFLEMHAGNMMNFDALDLVLSAQPVAHLSAEEDRELSKAFGPAGIFQGGLDPGDYAPAIRFFNGLYLSGQMYLTGSAQFPAPDYDAAYALLAGLMAQDPGNGAFAYFLAEIMKKRGEDPTAIKNVLLTAAGADYFDTFTSRLSRNLMQKGLSNASLFVQATGITASMPVPNYGPAQALINDFIAGGADNGEFARAMMNLGQLMMAPGRDSYQRPEFFFWLLIEYNMGYRIYEVAFKRLTPDAEISSDIVPPKAVMKEMQKKEIAFDAIMAIDDWAEKEISTGSVNFDEEHHDCPRGKLDDFLEKQRMIFRQSKGP